jgi:hypothetical protein
MVFTRYEGLAFVWTMVDGERGTTGLREATVTTELMRAGELTSESYPRAWHDPYDPELSKVDRSCLRFISDDARYDDRFPDHPLTRVRQLQRWVVSASNAELPRPRGRPRSRELTRDTDKGGARPDPMISRSE